MENKRTIREKRGNKKYEEYRFLFNKNAFKIRAIFWNILES
jgi:hypothetical protein